jgi:hypothetical protein
MLSSTPLFTAPYIYKNTKEWERIVQITFYSAVYDYFYQSVTETLWRSDTDAKWVLDVASWVEEDELFQDKKDLRSKQVSGLTQFESVDEAVRYAIDWVLAFQQKDLTAQITGRPWGTTDLSAYIITPGTPLYTSYGNLSAYTRPWHPRDLAARMSIYDYWADMNAYIDPSIHESKDLEASIKMWGPLSVHIEFGPEPVVPTDPNKANLMFTDHSNVWPPATPGEGKGFAQKAADLLASVFGYSEALDVDLELGAPNDPPEGDDIDIDFD